MHKAIRIATLLTALSACGDDGGQSTNDAGRLDAAAPLDADLTAGDAASPLGWVDFAVTGCASGEGSEASPCLGASPLHLRFTALAASPISTQLWTFGDSEPDVRLSPERTFAAPGSYDVTLNVEGPGGSAGVTRLAAVVVIPAPLAASCVSDSHCASGDCACEAIGSCPDLLGGGMCVRNCASHATCGGNRCIDLDPTGQDAQDWQRTTCLPACDPAASTCGVGRSCEELLGVDGVLTYACFPSGLLQPIGASCRDASGVLQDSRCASGVCLDKGARGLCSFDCSNLACPLGSGCADFVNGSPAEPHCLAECASSACDADGQLSCVEAGASFTIEGAASAGGYCASTPI